VRAVRFAAVLLALAGCASIPNLEAEKACEAVHLEVVMKGGSPQNLSPEGQSMAVDVRVYALAKRDAFDRLDQDAALTKAEDALGADMLANTRVTVYPADEEIVPMSVPLKTRYVALVGLFRRADGDGWSRVIDVSPLVAKCKPGDLAGLIRAQIVDNRIQAPVTVE